MQITFKVSISRSDGFVARLGETMEVGDEQAQEFISNEQAEPANAIKLPRAQPVKVTKGDENAKHWQNTR